MSHISYANVLLSFCEHTNLTKQADDPAKFQVLWKVLKQIRKQHKLPIEGMATWPRQISSRGPVMNIPHSEESHEIAVGVIITVISRDLLLIFIQ
jgi:hypothetical protein